MYKLIEYTNECTVQTDMNRMEDEGWKVVSTTVWVDGVNAALHHILVTYHRE